jgi:hypothetical protein
MRTLQIRETVTILKVDFPVDARIRPFMSPTRKRDPASLSSNRRRPLDIATSPRDQTSEFLMRCKSTYHAHAPCHAPSMHMHNRLLPNPRIMPFPSNRRTTCRRTPASKKPWPKKLWVPTNETEIRIRLGGGNVESEETVRGDDERWRPVVRCRKSGWSSLPDFLPLHRASPIAPFIATLPSLCST